MVTDGKFTVEKVLIVKLQNVNDVIPHIFYPKQNQTVNLNAEERDSLKLQVLKLFLLHKIIFN